MDVDLAGETNCLVDHGSVGKLGPTATACGSQDQLGGLDRSGEGGETVGDVAGHDLVVLAAEGYPDAPKKGAAIGALPAAAEDLHIFHAGTTASDGRVTVSGGRVLAVTALGDSVRMAQTRAYEAVSAIRFDGMQYRRDIGWRALDRSKK